MEGTGWFFLVEVQKARGRIAGDEDGEQARKQITWVVKDLTKNVAFIEMKSFGFVQHFGPSGQPTLGSIIPRELEFSPKPLFLYLFRALINLLP